MAIDAWNPITFGEEITAALSAHSRIVYDYHVEDHRLMGEHLRSSPYQSLEPNRYFPAYQEFREHILAPLLARSRIRAWHYTRLTDDEVDAMKRCLVVSSLDYLRHRLSTLVENDLLGRDDADTVFAQSPFQGQLRTGRLWTTVIPLPHNDSGVTPLLESWGGESAYFWLRDERVAATLKRLGTPRIVEIETALTDNHNGYSVAEIALRAWARRLGAPTNLCGCDLSITGSIASAKVIRIHTEGDGTFDAVATTYPEGVGPLLEEQVSYEYGELESEG